MNDNKIVALIPARSGSEGIIDKNIKLYKGIPLIGHSIKLALKCKYISNVYVSTDSIKYQEIAIELGAEVTPLRPKEISDSLSPDIDTFKHFIKNVNLNDVDIIIHLRPTYPNRKLETLNKCIELFIENYNKYDSLRTVVPIKKLPYKMYHIENNVLIPCIKEYKNFKEPYNQARQNFPDTFLHNGNIDIIKKNTIDSDLLSGNMILPFVMNEDDIDDIDDISDFINSENKNE